MMMVSTVSVITTTTRHLLRRQQRLTSSSSLVLLQQQSSCCSKFNNLSSSSSIFFLSNKNESRNITTTCCIASSSAGTATTTTTSSRTMTTTCTSTGNSNTTTSNNSTTTTDNIITATHKWFETIVVGEKLCPFAPPLLQNPNLLRIVHSTATTPEEAVQDVTREVQALLLLVDEDNNEEVEVEEEEEEEEEEEKSSSKSSSSSKERKRRRHHHHETTLITMDDQQSKFVKEFRDFIHLSWQLQEEAIGKEFVHLVQLVLFHPRATHQTYAEVVQEDEDAAAADYTIRSPYPTIHLLREVDVLKAVQGGYPNMEEIPNRNKEKLIRQGTELCNKRLQACYYHHH